jgi:hypothetical protein
MHAIKCVELLRLASVIHYQDVTEVIDDFNCLPTKWITNIRFTQIKNIAQILVQAGDFVGSPGMFTGLNALCNDRLNPPAVIRYRPTDETQPVSGLLHYRIIEPRGGWYAKYPKDAPLYLDDVIKVQHGKSSVDDGEIYICQLEVKRDVYHIYTDENPNMQEFRGSASDRGAYYAQATAANYGDITARLGALGIKSRITYEYCVDREATSALQMESTANYSSVLAAAHQNRSINHRPVFHASA